mmetsp:Transcript_22286/g.69010  ORF Transcript_22286/g.69010 Transcript_22286/m.69010 type:complete len:220 (-) Transcript_22286:83-742(-)
MMLLARASKPKLRLLRAHHVRQRQPPPPRQPLRCEARAWRQRSHVGRPARATSAAPQALRRLPRRWRRHCRATRVHPPCRSAPRRRSGRASWPGPCSRAPAASRAPAPPPPRGGAPASRCFCAGRRGGSRRLVRRQPAAGPPLWPGPWRAAGAAWPGRRRGLCWQPPVARVPPFAWQRPGGGRRGQPWPRPPPGLRGQRPRPGPQSLQRRAPRRWPARR